MPCILCKNDAKVTKRILLEDLSIKAKQYYESTNFVNWEYDYLCTSCYRRDFFRRARGNMLGLFISVFLKFAMIYTTSLAAWSFLTKYNYDSETVYYIPIIFSVCCTLFLYKAFLKIIMVVTFVVSATLIVVYLSAYSNSASFLPSMGAVVERQRMKQDGYAPVSSDKIKLTTGTTKNKGQRQQKLDPVEIAERKNQAARERTIKENLKKLEEYTPFHLRFGKKELKENLPKAIRGFAILYAILIPWYFLGMPVIRWWKERNKKNKRV